jgi:hypothetical protein
LMFGGTQRERLCRAVLRDGAPAVLAHREFGAIIRIPADRRVDDAAFLREPPPYDRVLFAFDLALCHVAR